jgi:hypothetical protein
LIAEPDLPYAKIIAPLIIADCGASMAIPTTQNVVVSAVAANEIGKASSTVNMMHQLGGAFGVAILAVVFAGIGSFGCGSAFGTHTTAHDGAHDAFMALPSYT